MITGIPEIKDNAHAPARIRALYDDIRKTLQTDVVNLIFRRLATLDGCLAQVWERLRPLYENGMLDELGDDLLRSVQPLPRVPLPAAAMRAVGLDGEKRGQIHAVVTAYNRNNARNLIGFKALLSANGPDRGAVAGTAPRATTETVPLPELLPLEDLPCSTRELLTALNSLGNEDSPDVIAGLYRHLAHWPGALALTAGILTPLHGLDWLTQRSEEVTNTADRLALTLPSQVQYPAAEAALTSTAVTRLTGTTIPKMIPVGLVLFEAFNYPDHRTD